MTSYIYFRFCLEYELNASLFLLYYYSSITEILYKMAPEPSTSVSAIAYMVMYSSLLLFKSSLCVTISVKSRSLISEWPIQQGSSPPWYCNIYWTTDSKGYYFHQYYMVRNITIYSRIIEIYNHSTIKLPL